MSSAALLWATNMALRLLQLVTTVVMARILSASDFGIIALAMTVVGFIDMISNLQLGGSIIRSYELDKAHLDTAFTMTLIRGVLCAAAMIVTAHPVALYMGNPTLEPVLYALSASALIGGIHNPYFILYERDMNFRKDAMRNTLCALTGSVVGIVGAFILRSYWALVLASVSTSLMTMLLSYWRVPGTARLSLKRRRELFGYASWLVLINAISYVNNRVDYFLIGRGLGSEKLGVYHLGQQVTAMATGDVVTPLGRALFPAFAMFADDLSRLRATYRRAQSIIIALALPLGFGISLIAAPLVTFVVGVKWLEAVPVIQFLAPLIALQTMTASVEAVALVMNKGKALFQRTAVFFVVRVSLMFGGYYLGGFDGIIYARVISGTFLLLYSLTLAARIVGGKTHDPIAASWRSCIAVLLMSGGLLLLPSPDVRYLSEAALSVLLIGKVILGGALYVTTHFVLWLMSGRPDGVETVILKQIQALHPNASHIR